MTTYAAGANARLDFTFKDAAGALTDVATVVVTITLPDATTTSLSLAGATVVRDSLGTYHATYVPAQTGHYTYRTVTTGGVVVDYVDEFDVRVGQPLLLVSLADVKKHLGKSATDTSEDTELRDLIEAATPVIEKLTGPIVPRTVIEWHDGGRGGRTRINARQRPVISVTSVKEYLGNVEYLLTEAASPAAASQFSFSLDAETGTITRRIAGGVGYPFPAGEQNIVVTYVAGFAVTPANVHTGALEVIRHVWQSTQQGGRPKFKGGQAVADDGATGRGYLLSYFAAEFFQPHERIPGLA